MKCLTKITSFLIVLAMVFSLSAPTSAMEKSSFEKLSLTEEEIERGIEQALQIKLAEIDNIEERKEMEIGIRENLENIDTSNISPDSIYTINWDLGDIWTPNLPDIHLKNKYVAGAIDTIISGILIASGVGTLAVALKKYGAKELQRMFTSTIKTKVIGKAAIALGISLPVIASYLNYVIDPAGAMAKYLDSKDAKPNNGYFDVVW